MAPRLSAQNFNFFTFLLSLNSLKRLGCKENNTKYRSLTWKPRSHVRTLIYRTWAILRDYLLYTCSRFLSVMWSKLKIVIVQLINLRIWDMIDNCNINNLAKNQVSAIFLSRAIHRCVLPKFTELCVETSGRCPSRWKPTWWRPETYRKICPGVLLQKRKFISRETQRQYSTTFSNARTVQIAKFPEISLGISHFLTSSAVMRSLSRHQEPIKNKNLYGC